MIGCVSTPVISRVHSPLFEWVYYGFQTTGTAAGIRRGCSGCNAAEPGVPSAVLTGRKATDSFPRTSPERILQADGRSCNGSEDSNNCKHNSQHQRRSCCLIRTTFGHDQRKILRRNIEPDETIHRSVNGSRAFRSPLQVLRVDLTRSKIFEKE